MDYQLMGVAGFCNYRWYKPLAEHLCNLIQPRYIFEIGFFFGSSSYCWLSSSNARVVSCDIIGDAAPECLKVVRNAQALGARFSNRLTFIPKSSQFIYDDVKHFQFDLAFVDGRHDYDGVAEDLALCHRLGVRYVYMDDFNSIVSQAWAQRFAGVYLPVHGVRFENGNKTNVVDGLLTRLASVDDPCIPPPNITCSPKARQTLASLVPQRMEILYMAAEATQRVPGEVWECGVYKGHSALGVRNHRSTQGKIMRLFDTYTGIPSRSEWDTHPIGAFSDTTEREVRDLFDGVANTIFHTGLLPGTFVGLERSIISLARIDVDQYQSTRDCLEFVYPRMSPEGWVVLDDYSCPGCPGAKKAIDEFMADKPEKIVYGPRPPQVYFVKR